MIDVTRLCLCAAYVLCVLYDCLRLAMPDETKSSAAAGMCCWHVLRVSRLASCTDDDDDALIRDARPLLLFVHTTTTTTTTTVSVDARDTTERGRQLLLLLIALTLVEWLSGGDGSSRRAMLLQPVCL